MKTILLLAMLVAVAYSQYFCPPAGQPLDCTDGPRTAARAYCLTDGTWVCGKCAIKARYCSDGVMETRNESTCTNRGNAKPNCSTRPG